MPKCSDCHSEMPPKRQQQIRSKLSSIQMKIVEFDNEGVCDETDVDECRE